LLFIDRISFSLVDEKAKKRRTHCSDLAKCMIGLKGFLLNEY